MDTKSKIADIIEESFDYIYCFNCKHQDTEDEACDYCHRKYMVWQVSRETAEQVAEKILALE